MVRVEKPPPQPKPEEVKPPQPLAKIMFIGILAIVASGLFWFSLANIFDKGIKFSFGSNTTFILVFSLLAFCLMLATIGTALIISRKLWSIVIIIASALVPFIFFPPSIALVITVLLLFLTFLYWRREIRIDIESRLRFLPKRVVKAGLATVLSLALLAVAVTYYGFLVSGEKGSTRVMDAIAKTATNVINAALPLTYPGYRTNMTLDEFIAGTSSITETKLEAGNTGFSEQILTQALSAAQGEVVAEARQKFLETFSIEAEGSDPMTVVIEKIVRKKADQFIKPYEKFIPALLALGIYYILHIFSFLYSGLTLSMSYLIFSLLKWTKFLSIKKIQVEADRVVLKE